MSQCSSARIRQMPELLPLTARLRCGCLDAVPALAGSEDHHRGAEPTRQRDLREERVLQHLHYNEAGPAHDVPRVYSLHGDNLVSTVPFRLSDLPSIPPIDAVLCSTPCYDKLEGDHREAQGLGIRGTQPEPVTCFVCMRTNIRSLARTFSSSMQRSYTCSTFSQLSRRLASSSFA